ncbi:hypothetical protein ABTZ78_10125 [Streptomyces bauhiniae]
MSEQIVHIRGDATAPCAEAPSSAASVAGRLVGRGVSVSVYDLGEGV